jgi:hypothetical protein
MATYIRDLTSRKSAFVVGARVAVGLWLDVCAVCAHEAVAKEPAASGEFFVSSTTLRKNSPCVAGPSIDHELALFRQPPAQGTFWSFQFNLHTSNVWLPTCTSTHQFALTNYEDGKFVKLTSSSDNAHHFAPAQFHLPDPICAIAWSGCSRQCSFYALVAHGMERHLRCCLTRVRLLKQRYQHLHVAAPTLERLGTKQG